jgi:poly(hydroxyalkanoate) depolymerase family esterase
MHTKMRAGRSRTAARLICAAAVLAATLCLSARAAAATVQQITAFGNNPTGIGMYLYTPTNVVSRPPILVGVHACHGKGTDVCANGTPFAQQADRYGFLLVCPSAVSSDGCWDVHSNAVLTHNGGGDATGIMSMVNYLVQNKNADASRIYVAGHSSGGMMTNVLVGSYPDVFKAGAAFAGVPFACFAQGTVDSLGWNSSCANGNVAMTGAQWGDIVRAAYPGYTGPRPRMQLWHGTADATVLFHNFGEEIKEWTNVLAVSETPASTENNAIQSGWIRTRYVDGGGVVQVEAIQETGQPHNLVLDLADAIHFFGLDGSSAVPDAGTDARGDASGTDAGSDAATGGRGGAGGGSSGRGGAGGAAGAGGAGGAGRGGVSGTGGMTAGTGGSGGGAPGGSSGSGGAGAAGGAAGGAGTGGSGGASLGGAGGNAASGGSSGTGGSGIGSGGTTTTGGGGIITGSGGTTGTAGRGGSADGCSCDVNGAAGNHASGWLVLALAFGWKARRRGRASKRSFS